MWRWNTGLLLTTIVVFAHLRNINQRRPRFSCSAEVELETPSSRSALAPQACLSDGGRARSSRQDSLVAFSDEHVRRTGPGGTVWWRKLMRLPWEPLHTCIANMM